jgi:hypothetical protein
MRELNTKPGVFLTTYTQDEIDFILEGYVDSLESDGAKLFLNDLRSFSEESDYLIDEKEAIELVGLEKKKSKTIKSDLYTNYKGNPLGMSVSEATLYFTSALMSLRSAFEVAAPSFDFEKDSFHINIIK